MAGQPGARRGRGGDAHALRGDVRRTSKAGPANGDRFVGTVSRCPAHDPGTAGLDGRRASPRQQTRARPQPARASRLMMDTRPSRRPVTTWLRSPATITSTDKGSSFTMPGARYSEVPWSMGHGAGLSTSPLRRYPESSPAVGPETRLGIGGARSIYRESPREPDHRPAEPRPCPRPDE